MNIHVVRFGLAGLLTLSGLVAIAGTARAVDIRSGDTVRIAAEEVIDDDLVITAQRIVVDGTVRGNLFAAGTEVIVNGTIDGSLFVGAQRAEVNGAVTGSFFGGGSCTIGPKASIGRNVLVGGYTLTASPGSTIGRDALFGGLVATFEGDVARDVKVGSDALIINGRVGGDVVAEVGNPAAGPTFMGPIPFAPDLPVSIDPGVRIGPKATIAGQLTYTSVSQEGHTIEAQPVGGVVYQTPMPGETPDAVTPPSPQATAFTTVLGWITDRIRDFLTLMLLGALVLWRWPEAVTRVAEAAQRKPWPALGWGLVIVIVGYVGAVLIGGLVLAVGLGFWVVTLGGLSGTVFTVGFSSLGVALAIFSLLVGYGSKLVVSWMLGRFIARAFNSENVWLALLLGVSVYVLVSGIPFLGWIVALIATLLGVGAMWLVVRDWRLAPAPRLVPSEAPAA